MIGQRAPSVVLLTPQGRAAVASLLVEGDDVVGIVEALFHPATGRSLADRPCGQIVFGRWQSSSTGEEVVVCRRAPARVEIHCHGGRAAARAIIDALAGHGCGEVSWQQWVRQSTPEAIAADARIALARAATERTAIILWDQHAGALGHAVRTIRDLAASSDSLRAVEAIDSLLEWSALGRHLVEPWKVVLAGRPNVGKSSLINALLGYQRAIAHPTPGTTRDVVTAAAAFDGWPVELADTAGLRGGGQPLEAAGMRLAHDMLRAADLVVLISDGSQPWLSDKDDLSRDWPDALHVENKCDLPPGAGPSDPAAIRTSALRGDGLGQLERAIATRLVPRVPPDGQPMPFLDCHVDALAAARAALAAGQLAAAQAALAKFGPC